MGDWKYWSFFSGLNPEHVFKEHFIDEFGIETVRFHNSIPPVKINIAGKQINTSVFEELKIIET